MPTMCPSDQVRVFGDKITHYKKGGGGLVLFQCIQDGGGVAVLIACVKGQVDPLFICVAQIVGVVLRQLLGGGVSHRGLALLLEAKAPVPLRGGLDPVRVGGGDKGGHLGGGAAEEKGGGQEKCDPEAGEWFYFAVHRDVSLLLQLSLHYMREAGCV